MEPDANSTISDNTSKTTTKSASSEKFSASATEIVISQWSREEVLFNCKHPSYFHKDHRAAAMQRVLLAVNKEGLTIAELQKKMACLRTYYAKEYGKEKASIVSGTSTKKVYVSKWPFYTSLSFLRDNITPRKTTSTIVVDDEPISSADCVEKDSGHENIQNVVINPPTSQRNTKRKLSLEDELLSSCIQELKKPKNEEKNGADATFAKYLTDQLHKVPEGVQKELLKLEIQKLIVSALIPATGRQPLSTINFGDLQ